MYKFGNIAAVAGGLLFVSACVAFMTSGPSYAQAAGGPQVTVVNGQDRPVPVQVTNEPAARFPFVAIKEDTMGPGIVGKSVSLGTVPTGHRLVIESSSLTMFSSNDTYIELVLVGQFQGEPVRYGILSAETPSQKFVDSRAGKWFFDGGTIVKAAVARIGAFGDTFEVSVSGYLEPIQ
jgi:hypothetical protein